MFSLCVTCREHAYLLLPQKWAHAHKSTSKLGVQKIKRGLSPLRGVRKKSGPSVKRSNFSAYLGPTETYYIPNQWKFNKAFAELCRFEIAALFD